MYLLLCSRGSPYSPPSPGGRDVNSNQANRLNSMHKSLDKTLDKIAATSPKTIREAAERSIECQKGYDGEYSPEMGHRTHAMNIRNKLYRRRNGDF